MGPDRLALEEHALYEGLRHGSGRAFRRLVDRHQGAMLRVAGWYVPGEAERAALVRRAWLIALDGLNMFTWRTTLRAWLFGILVSAGRSSRAPQAGVHHGGVVATAEGLADLGQRELGQLAGQVHRDLPGVHVPEPSEETGQGGAAVDWANLPWAREWTADAAGVLEDTLGGLALGEAEAVRFRDVEGWPLGETCDVLGLTSAEARRLLHAGRTRLGERVRVHLGVAGCGDCDVPGLRLTGHLEDAEPVEEGHLRSCAACRCRLDQLQGVRSALALLAPADTAVPPDRELTAAFRRWRSARRLHAWRRLPRTL